MSLRCTSSSKRINLKFPCISCNSSVKNNQDAVMCVKCNQWCHVRCNVSPEIHQSDVDWICNICCFNELPFYFDKDDLSIVMNDQVSFTDNVDVPAQTFNSSSSQNVYHTSANLKGNGLKLGHLNIRSLRNKVDHIQFLLHEYPLDVFAVSESWLDSSISDAEMSIHNYNLERKDRNITGGGVACYIRSNMRHLRRSDLECEELEVMWLEIKITNSKPWFIGIMYRPPNSKLDFFQKLEDNLERVLDISRNVTLIGDFNCNVSSKNPLSDKIKSLCVDLQLQQLIDAPTRVTNNSSTCIDLILLPQEKTDFQSGVISIGISDHSLIYVNLKERIRGNKAHFSYFRSFKNFDKLKFQSDGSEMSWECNTDNNNVEHLWDDFKTKFLKLCNAHAPKVSVRKKRKCSPWITSEYIELSRDRDYLKRKFDQTGELLYWKKYQKSRNTLNNLNKKLKKQYFFNQFQAHSGDSKMTWKILNEFAPCTKSSQIELNIDGKHFSDPLEVAEAFNEHFTTPVINTDGPVNSPSTPSMLSNSKFAFSTITKEVVADELSNLATDKAPGIDDIHPRLLKEGASFIAAPLTHMFNVSLQTARNPSDWKKSRVTPIFKSGDKTDPGNYRPISITSSVMKILEKLLDKQVRQYLKDNNILSKCQSGFRPLHSTNTAVIDLNDYLLKNIDEGFLTGAIYLVLKRAFDTVRHLLLIRKLSRYGFGAKEIAWFTDYFTGREQCVCINNECSDFKPVSIGVPQGSLLGPLLFTLFIDDICNINFDSSTKVCLYADDTAVFVRGRIAPIISQTLQAEFDKICVWLQKNCLALNINKTKSMLIGSKGRLKNSKLEVNHNDVPIQQVESFKYLGVTIDQNLKWDNHVALIRSKIARSIGRIQRIKYFLPKRILTLLYFSFVLPHFDYCNVIWGRTSQSNLLKLQRLQNRYARIVLDADFLTPHKEMLHALGWQSVTQRIQYNTSLIMYKVINNLAPVYLQQLVQEREVSFVTRYAIACPLLIRKPRTDYFKRSFHYQGSNVWNKLPDCVRSLPSLPLYKKQVKTLSLIDRL